MKYKVKLNPAPTDVQFATYRRHKKAGTTPGNPKWYKPLVVKPFIFREGKPPVYPHVETGAQWNAWHSRFSVHETTNIKTRYVGERD